MGAFQILTPLFQLALDYEKEIPAFTQRHVVSFVLKTTKWRVALSLCVFARSLRIQTKKKTEQIFNTANKYWKHYTCLPTYPNIWLK